MDGGGEGGKRRENFCPCTLYRFTVCLLPSGADLVAYVRAAISLCICGKHEEAMVPLFKGTGLLKVWFV